MNWNRTLFAAAAGLFAASCSDPTPHPANTAIASSQAAAGNAVITLGNRPVADLSRAIPQRAVVCFGLHFGLLTEAERGPADPLLPADLQKTCSDAARELVGACASYASAAAHLGEVAADMAKRPEAEADAEAALRRCQKAQIP